LGRGPKKAPPQRAGAVVAVLTGQPLVGQFADLPTAQETLAVDGGVKANAVFSQPFKIFQRPLAVDVFHVPRAAGDWPVTILGRRENGESTIQLIDQAAHNA
jgi:hypothetical protein